MSDYKTQSSDTSIEAERFLIERYRAMTPAEKFDIVRRLCLACEQLALAGARRLHPDASERELRLRVAATRIPADLMKKAFGWPEP